MVTWAQVPEVLTRGLPNRRALPRKCHAGHSNHVVSSAHWAGFQLFDFPIHS